MEAKELRIGNLIRSYIYDFYEDVIFKSDLYNDIEVDIVTLEKLRDDDQYSFFEPIPLTEEWMLNFGFEKIDYVSSPRYEFEDFYIGYNENGFYLQIESQIQSNFFIHVHQLQNIYFALTEEELILKA